MESKDQSVQPRKVSSPQDHPGSKSQQTNKKTGINLGSMRLQPKDFIHIPTQPAKQRLGQLGLGEVLIEAPAEGQTLERFRQHRVTQALIELGPKP